MKVATVHGVPNISERNSMNSKKSDKLEEFPKENTSLRMTAVTLLGLFQSLHTTTAVTYVADGLKISEIFACFRYCAGVRKHAQIRP